MSEQRDDIDALLAVGDSYLDDGGFTERVQARLPRHRRRRGLVRFGVIGVATLLAAVVGWVALPIAEIVAAVPALTTGGWSSPGFIAGVVSLAVVIWAAVTAAFSES